MAQQAMGRQGTQARTIPVRIKLTLAMLVLALGPLLVVGALVTNRVEEVVVRQLAADSQAAARERAQQLEQEMARVQSLGYSIGAAQTTRFIGAPRRQREEYLQGILASTPGLKRLAIIQLDGTLMAVFPSEEERPQALPDAARSGQVSSAVTSDIDGRPVYKIHVPIMTQGQVRMVLAATMDFQSLVGSAQLPRATDGASLTIVDREGQVIYSTLTNYGELFKGADMRADGMVGEALRGQPAAGWSTGPYGDAYIAATPVTGSNWVVMYAVPSRAALSTLAALRADLVRDLILLTGLLTVIVLGLALLLGRSLVSPILRVCGVMSRVRSGDLQARVPAMSNDELGTLGHDLNATLDSVVALVQTREERDQLQRGITRLLDEVSMVASGDLTTQAQVTADQTGAIADAFNYMIDELRSLVERMQTTADQVTTAATTVTGLTDELVVSADEQTRRLDEARGSVTTMTSLMTEVRTTVGESVAAIGAARTAVGSGQQAVGETLEAMTRLRSETQETAKKIKRLGESSQEIGEVVRLINEIADQTHLLALNASIHAAMAGEHGRGFAVVAEEVRQLAERSAGATAKIEDLIRAIQIDTSAAMVAMERSTKEVVTSSRLADQTGHALTSIDEVTDKIASLSAQIETLVEHQFQSAWALEGTVREVVGTTAEATQAVRSVAEGMQELNELAETLREVVSVFRVERDEADEVVETAADGEVGSAVAA